jgi:hypothetical protein
VRREADARLRRAAEALPPDCAALAAVEVDGVDGRAEALWGSFERV